MKHRNLLALVPVLALACAASADLPPPQTATVFGQRIRYYELGSGPTVVLLHGLGSSAPLDWGTVMTAISKEHRVIAPDQLGFGDSDKPLIDYRIQTWVDFLGEFLRQKGVDHFTLAGESLGGWIAAQYSIQALTGKAAGPSYVLPKPDRLVLCDAGGHGIHQASSAAPAPTAIPLDTSSLEGCRNLLTLIFHDPARHSDEAVRQFFAGSLGRGDRYTIHSLLSNPALAGEFIDGKLASITIPTLVVWGEDDAVVPPADGRDFAAKIPGARLVVIPECGHATEVEKPELFLAAFMPFAAARH